MTVLCYSICTNGVERLPTEEARAVPFGDYTSLRGLAPLRDGEQEQGSLPYGNTQKIQEGQTGQL